MLEYYKDGQSMDARARVCVREREFRGRLGGSGSGDGGCRGVMGRAAVHPFALYPQSKHDKWAPSLA